MYKAIAAMDKNRVIGNSQDDMIPWHFSKDFAWLKEKTLGSPIIMGATTFKSLGYKGLPKRTNIVLSKTLQQSDYPDVLIYKELQDILDNHKEAFVIGGAQIYKLFAEMDLLDEVILTKIEGEFDGDVKLPELEKGMKIVDEQEIVDTNKKDNKEYNLKFVTYKK